jgi:transposase
VTSVFEAVRGARFVVNLLRDDIDLGEITGRYGSERGQPPFDPIRMTALLLYSYCCGIYSLRRIAKACHERIDMSIVGLDAPDFRTIAEFRKRHLKALGALFRQILQLCETAGLVRLGHVALDGTTALTKPASENVLPKWPVSKP